MCGKLNKAMYGTRDAAQNWEYEYCQLMEGIGFKRGKASPCIFYHPQRGIRIVVHGDDFTVLGNTHQLDWFRQEISKRYEVKFRGRIGPEEGDDKAIRILNRIVTWDRNGIRYEADQRNAEIIVQQCNLTGNAKSVVTPGTKPSDDDYEIDDDDELNKEGTSMYRALVARANYISQDRTDIMYATKELSRGMSRPTVGNLKSLKRLARYLKGKERSVLEYNYQCNDRYLNVWVDTDYAGCRRTRKSTSGGMILLGGHVIKAWSTTQNVIALSSGEAEYYGMVKGGSQGTGAQSILNDMGIARGIKLCTDASAAKGIASRKGLGKARHIEVSQLWLQDKVGRGDINVLKVSGHENIADALTKHIEASKLEKHCMKIGLKFSGDRHNLMPKVAEDES